jgi:cysteinyl-tRNA synthetase
MTKEQMNELADLIIEKLTDKQKEMDQEFISQLEMSSVPIDVHQKLSENDKILMEIASLVLKIDKFVEEENYEKADFLRQKINHLRSKLKDNL